MLLAPRAKIYLHYSTSVMSFSFWGLFFIEVADIRGLNFTRWPLGYYYDKGLKVLGGLIVALS
jgi:hypothetical protein